MKLLVAMDGSECSLRALQYAMRRSEECASHAVFEIHVLNVQVPLPSHVGRHLSAADIQHYYRDEGEKDLRRAREMLAATTAKHEFHIAVGKPSDVIARYTEDLGIDEVVMGTRGLGNVAEILLGSVSEDVLRQVSVPVTLVK